MKHKFTIFLENITLLSIFVIAIYYIITFVLSFFTDIKITLPKVDANLSVLSIDTDVLLKDYIKKDNLSKIDNNITFLKKENNNSRDRIINTNIVKSSIINKIDINETNHDKNKTLLNNNSLNLDKNKLTTNSNNKSLNIDKSIKTKLNKATTNSNNTRLKKENLNLNKTTNKKKEKVSVKKNVVLNKKDIIKILHSYINNVKKTIESNTPNITNLKDNTIKIRITVLRNGNYQNFKYISGNKRLIYDTNKAVKKTFPMPFNDIIKNQFPRYLRLTIKY